MALRKDSTAENKPLAVGELRQLFRLDIHTGELRWAIKPSQRVSVGDVAGSVEAKTGYVRVRVRGRKVMAHRIVWALVHGAWPEHEVDHKDLNQANNRPDNLRAATAVQNRANQPARATNQLGLKGVYFNRRIGKFHAQIGLGGRKVHLGFFGAATDAHAAYMAAAVAAHGEFARAAA